MYEILHAQELQRVLLSRMHVPHSLTSPFMPDLQQAALIDRLSWSMRSTHQRLGKPAWALFTSTQKSKIFQDSLSHRIFRRMHEVLNIDGNKN